MEEICEKKHYVYKVLVAGDYGVGKTSLIRRYNDGINSSSYRITLGVDFCVKTIDWDDNSVIDIQLWNIAGHERFGQMTRPYYKYAVAAVICFDLSKYSQHSLESVKKWRDDINDKVELPNGSPILMILFANKCDLPNIVIDEEVDKFCKENGFFTWRKTSSRSNFNIDESIKILVKKIVEVQIKDNMKEYKAIKDCNKAIELKPNVAKNFYNRGYAYNVIGKYEEALKDFCTSKMLGSNCQSKIDELQEIVKSPLFKKLKKYQVEEFYKYFEKKSVSSDIQLLMFLKPESYQELETIILNEEIRYKFIEKLERINVIYEGSYNVSRLYDGFGCLFVFESSFLGFRKKRVKIYEGEFKNGKRNGRGKLFHPNSNKIKFFGNFVKGKMEGFGIEKNLNGKIIRRGKWKEGKLIEEVKVRNVIEEIDSEKMEIFMKNVMNANLSIRESYILGYGTNTIVYKFTEINAFKHYQKVTAEKEIEIFKKEVGFLSNINHSNIVKIVGVSSKKPIGILTEICEMDVSSLIKRGIRLSFLEKVKILYQTCLGLEYIHIICIQHRDLKWQNVLITKAQPVRKVKIADFGLAKVKDSFTSTKNTIVGSLEYIAPEVTTGKYSYPSDVFSFGIMIYEMLFDTLDPYDMKNNPSRKNPSVLLHLVSKVNLKPEIPKNKVNKENEWLVDVIQNCIKHRADKRPIFSTIVNIIRKNCSKCVEDILPFNFEDKNE